jgi:hypothetical protein
VNRFGRFCNTWSIFGPWDRLTWKTLFPPFTGWDVGCGYCALEESAVKARRCDRSRAFRHAGKCGVASLPLDDAPAVKVNLPR